jgi:fructose transport system ATP-binding protein
VSQQTTRTPVLAATGLVKVFGHVEALRGADFDLYPGEVLAVIGDNGAGKSTLIQCLSGAITPDDGHIFFDGAEVRFKDPLQARHAGIETLYQSLAVSPALDIASNIYLGRELRRRDLFGRIFRMLDIGTMRRLAEEYVRNLGIETLQDITQRVEVLSGGQRQAVAIARAAAFGSKVIILDEPTAALGVREAAHVEDLIRMLRARGLAVVLISHNMPSVFRLADRIHIQRLGRRVAVVTPQSHSMPEVVAIMTGAAAA